MKEEILIDLGAVSEETCGMLVAVFFETNYILCQDEFWYDLCS